ncbi:hypothetical protein Acr_20g0010010 [Actinidia rufa]|uniref:Uncharacterized protein n=1 Tax=Actinidia rufa TaxID=165716 RepID=A0A7J0GEG1_9ERIC|nr:hypothetical protein Acr_20g0010010 [Actinidia rufa]
MPSRDWILYSYVLCPYNSPPIRVSSVAARRGYVSWMFRLCIPNFFFTVLSVPNVWGAARLLRSRLVSVGAVVGMLPREKKVVAAGPSCLLVISFPVDCGFTIACQRSVPTRHGPRLRSLLSDEVSDLFEGTSGGFSEEAEGKSSGSSELSSSSWDVDLGDEGLDEEAEVEDGKKVGQVSTTAPLVPVPLVLVPEPINLPSSNFDIAIVKPREIVEHSYSHSGSSSSDSQGNEEIMAPKVRTLGKGQALRIEPPMLPKAPNLSMPILAEDQSIVPSSMAGGNAVMLPQDVEDHAAETTAEFGGKLVMLGAQANNLEKELKQTKSELADARSTAKITTLQRNQAQQEASDLKAFACGEVYKKLFDRAFERAGDVYERQLAKLCPDIFQEGWLACLKELKIPLDHPSWSSPAPSIQLPASSERYSPIIFPDFNEEEYATLLADEGNINTAVAKARTGIEGTVDRDRAGEAEGDRAREAKDRYLARVGCLVELASPSPPAFAEYRSLVGVMPYLQAAIHKTQKNQLKAACCASYSTR